MTSSSTVPPRGNAKSTEENRISRASGGNAAASGRSATSGRWSSSDCTRRSPAAARWNGSTIPESCWTAEIMNHSSSKIAMTDPTVRAPRRDSRVAEPMAKASRA